MSLKDIVKEIPKFADCGKFHRNIFYLFKNPGKLKTKTKNAAAALNISSYTLHKIYGTRFLDHRHRGFKNLLYNWHALITGFENVLVNDCGSSRETRAKIKGILIKLKYSYSFLCKVVLYLDILKALGPFPLIFEKNLPVEKTVFNL